MIFLRSILFNIAFCGATAALCLICLPGLLLPRRGAVVIIRTFVNTVYFLEKHILGLDYEVRGLENLPKEGSYIIAAKHQSTYETLKLHRLFKFPAVVLKKELLDIPLWGKFLARSEPIAIDRSQGKEAIQQIINGALEVEKQNRPIIIFPQGTRVHSRQTVREKPYKPGVARMFKSTHMPVVPLALNSGLFWPRDSWVKRPGKVIFEFLPPIGHGEFPDTFLKVLEERLESASKALEDEALASNKNLSPSPGGRGNEAWLF